MKRILGVLIAFGLFQSGQAGLVCSEEHDGIAYFAFGSPNKIERFDLTADSGWRRSGISAATDGR